MRTYARTHPWITFEIDLSKASPRLWMALGEAQSKCEHVAGNPLTPETARELHQLYLAKGVLATTAIEGNTLSEDEVRKHLNGQLQLPPSREYQQREIQNIIKAFNQMLEEITHDNIAPISLATAKKYNMLILDNLDLGEDVIPGEIRRDSRVVGRYLCAPADDCEYLLAKFCKWMNSDTFTPRDGDEIVYGLIKAIVSHLYFVWIHPFGDGNGRTARLIELQFLMEAGVPSDAAHLLSNHYNQTRSEYYRKLDQASGSGGDILPFVEYAVRGFVQQLREQITVIREQQLDVTWVNYVHDRFRADKSNVARRRRALALAISEANRPVRKNELDRLTPELAAAYARKTPKTISRDLNALLQMKLVRLYPHGYVPAKNEIVAFLPLRRQTTNQNINHDNDGLIELMANDGREEEEQIARL